jgi:ribosomal protein S18 acetylase RimI-like enzyme
MAVTDSDPGPAIDNRFYGPWAADGPADRIWACYHGVFGDFHDRETWRRELLNRHAARAGYRLAVATDGDTTAGFAWGLHRPARPVLDGPGMRGAAGRGHQGVGRGHFEFVELAVLASYRRQGIGLRLHDVLLSDVRHKCLLSTADDPDDPAVRLYLRHGWQRLGVLGPGFQVLGRPAS